MRDQKPVHRARPHEAWIQQAGLLVIAAVLGLLVVPGCGRSADSSAADDEAAAAEPEAAALRLYSFDCGRLRGESVAAFGLTDEETDVRELVVPCYVIEHERGLLLWDGGLPSATAESGDWVDGPMQMRLERTFADQLADLDLGMSDFDYVAFSHMHFDHVGVANEVQDAVLLIQKAELEAAFGENAAANQIYQPDLYAGLAELERIELDGDHDVFGDGRVRILSAPGHTAGHQMLFVDLASGPVLLSGDLYHFRFSYENRRVPEFNVDREQTIASMERIDRFLEETGAELWIEHELAGFEQRPKAPAASE